MIKHCMIKQDQKLFQLNSEIVIDTYYLIKATDIPSIQVLKNFVQ